MNKYPFCSSDKFRSEKRRRISFLITSNSAWQVELSSCPSPGLLNLAKIPICFVCGGSGRGGDSSSHRIRKSWNKYLALTNREPQFWIKVKLLRYSTALVFHFILLCFVSGIGTGCGMEWVIRNDRSKFQLILMEFLSYKGYSCSPDFFGCKLGESVHNLLSELPYSTPMLSFLEFQDTPEASEWTPWNVMKQELATLFYQAANLKKKLWGVEVQ